MKMHKRPTSFEDKMEGFGFFHSADENSLSTPDPLGCMLPEDNVTFAMVKDLNESSSSSSEEDEEDEAAATAPEAASPAANHPEEAHPAAEAEPEVEETTCVRQRLTWQSRRRWRRRRQPRCRRWSSRKWLSVGKWQQKQGPHMESAGCVVRQAAPCQTSTQAYAQAYVQRASGSAGCRQRWRRR
jgi:hypothetical protein